LNNALVKAGADSIITNSLGLALFRMVTVPSRFYFTIRKAGYVSMENDFDLVTDTTIELNIQKVNLNTWFTGNIDDFEIWPNPAEKHLFCRFPEELIHSFLSVTDMLGNVLANTRFMAKR
jgi:hypothetical protein